MADLIKSASPSPTAPASWSKPLRIIASVDGALRSNTSALLIVGIGICLALQLHLAFAQPINWDEFRFLADVHAHARGELTQPLQTFQVHFFGWLSGLGSEAEQVVIARLVMLLLEAGTLGLIHYVSRRFVETPAALFAVLAYVSFSFVLRHGASFRFDPISTFLLMATVAFLLAPHLRLKNMLLAGAAMSLAAMVTVKAAFYLPLIVIAGCFRLLMTEDRRRASLLLGSAALAACIFLPLFYLAHLSSLATADTAAAQANISGSYQKTIGQGLLFPRLPEFITSLAANPVQWLFLLLGISGAAGASIKGPRRSEALLLLGFATPLAAILFYRNAFPYFYAFMLAPAVVLVAAAATRQEWRTRLVYPALAMLLGALIHYQAGFSAARENQRSILEAVHEIFPEPVAYIDRASMVSSFPQVGLFFSTWGIESYLSAGQPIMRNFLIEKRPAFVIANSPLLIDALVEPPAGEGPQLLPEDGDALRENYIPHWGPVYVLGKSIDLTTGHRSIEILAEGVYTLEAAQPVSVDGKVYSPGQVIFLSLGDHVVSSPSGARSAILRWGDHLKRPDNSAPQGPIFGDF